LGNNLQLTVGSREKRQKLSAEMYSHQRAPLKCQVMGHALHMIDLGFLASKEVHKEARKAEGF
jgi:hypothetical protein